MKITVMSFLLLANFAFAQQEKRQEEQGKLIVEASGFQNQKGSFLVKLFSEKQKDFFPEGKNKNEYLRAGKTEILKDKTSKLTFSEIPEGCYAISSFHDVDNSKKLEKNFLGIPKKPWAVSNNARPILRAPNFAESSFCVKKNEGITIKLELK